MNFKNKKNRLNIYRRTFMKWNLETRIATLQEQAIQLSLYSGSFLHDLENKEKYKAFYGAIGSLETMIEVAKESLETLAENSAESKYEKLQKLKNHTDKIAIENIEVKNPEIVNFDKELNSELKKAEFKLQEAKAEKVCKSFKPDKFSLKTFFSKIIFWK